MDYRNRLRKLEEAPALRPPQGGQVVVYYTVEPVLDEHGNPVYDQQGNVQQRVTSAEPTPERLAEAQREADEQARKYGHGVAFVGPTAEDEEEPELHLLVDNDEEEGD